MPGYFVYCRKSSESEDRQVLSIDAQRDEMLRLAQHRGLGIKEILVEARSAKAPGRPVFSSMLTRLRAREAQGILCWKPDRLARNPVDGGTLLWAMKTHGIEIVTPSQVFRQGDDNKILLHIEFGMAEKYIDDLSRNVKRGNRAKMERGGWPHMAPPGYLNDRLNKTILKDVDRFPLLRRAWDLLISGNHSVMRILVTLNEEWGYRTPRGVPMARGSLYRIFTNAFYYGQMESAVGSARGNHEPMITREEFNRAQRYVGRRARLRPSRHAFTYGGLIRCGECGCRITAEHKVNRYGSRYTYYHCTRRRPCTQRVIQEAALERQFLQFLTRISLPPVLVDWAFQNLEAPLRADAEHHASVRRTLDLAIRQAERALSNLTLMRAKEHITEAEFLVERPRLEQELTKLRESRPSEDPQLDASAELFLLAAQAYPAFADGNPATRRQLITALCSNLSLKDKILTVDAQKPFGVIAEGLRALGGGSPTLEPSHHGFTTRDLLGFMNPKDTMWALVDEVRTSLQSLGDLKEFRESAKSLLEKIGVLITTTTVPEKKEKQERGKLAA